MDPDPDKSRLDPEYCLPQPRLFYKKEPSTQAKETPFATC